MITQRNQAPAFFDVGRRAEVVRMHDRPLSGEFRRRRFGRARRDLLVSLHQLPDVFLERAELGDLRIDPLEERYDLAFGCLALGVIADLVELSGNAVVFDSQLFGIRHATTASSASFSLADSSLLVLNTTMVRLSRTTIPVMYSAARPRTMAGG